MAPCGLATWAIAGLPSGAVSSQLDADEHLTWVATRFFWFERRRVELVERRQLMRRAAAGVTGIVGAQMLGATDVAGADGGRGAGGGLRQVRLVNLSHVNDPATTSLFPGDPEFTLETVATVPQDRFYMQYVREGEHTARTGERRPTSRRTGSRRIYWIPTTCSCRR